MITNPDVKPQCHVVTCSMFPYTRAPFIAVYLPSFYENTSANLVIMKSKRENKWRR